MFHHLIWKLAHKRQKYEEIMWNRTDQSSVWVWTKQFNFYILVRPTGHYIEIVGLNPEIEKWCSGFSFRGHHLAVVGLNPEVEKLKSVFRPIGHYLAMGDSNPEVEKLKSVFKPRGHYLLIGGSNPEYEILNSGFIP